MTADVSTVLDTDGGDGGVAPDEVSSSSLLSPLIDHDH